MILPVPKYLQVANINDTSIRYEWDDWRTLPALQTIDENLKSRLRKISQRAVITFMCGTAEWIVYRFSKLYEDPDLSAYLEAAWAMSIDVRYCVCGCGGIGWQEYSIKGWDGPIKNPIADALERLEIAIQKLAWEGTDPVRRAALLAALATYVMTDPATYNRWVALVLGRLESVYPRDPEDKLGDVVPREAIDPEFDFKIGQAETLINQFLAGLDFHTNIFLSTPEDILESDDEEEEEFQGIPYVYSIEGDRKARRKAIGHSHDT